MVRFAEDLTWKSGYGYVAVWEWYVKIDPGVGLLRVPLKSCDDKRFEFMIGEERMGWGLGLG